MATCISNSPEATRALGRAWAAEAQPGWVIALTGDLGAGKTQLVMGLAAGLGVTDRVHSPTFSLLNAYGGGRLPLHHLDLYRLDSAEAVIRAGLEDYLVRPPGVAVVEWGEKWFDLADRRAGDGVRLRRVRLDTVSEWERRITYDDPGA